MKLISIIIPNYNGSKFIGQTVKQFATGFPDVKIIVVDDKSTDNSVDELRKLPVELIERDSNGGFAAAVNSGLRYLEPNDEKYVLIANSDIDLEIETAALIAHSIESCKSNEESDIIGYLESHLTNISNFNGAKISGFLFALKTDVPRKIGYMDEKFFMYGEEQDYFERALLYGLKITQSGIRVKHRAEKSGKGHATRNSWLAIRNTIYIEVKNLRLLKAIWKITAIAAIVNCLYIPNRGIDESFGRIKRSGIVFGNILLIGAIFWNLKEMLYQLKRRIV